MKIILLEDVKGKGYENDIIEVKDGYGKNFLIKKGLGVEYNEETKHELELKKETIRLQREFEIEEAKRIGKEILKHKFVIERQNKEGKLYKSISKKELSNIILDTTEEHVIPQQIKLSIDKIEFVGEYEFEITLTKNVKVKSKLTVK